MWTSILKQHNRNKKYKIISKVFKNLNKKSEVVNVKNIVLDKW
jgi:hypothetical protein